jgi:hypothetical protein
MTEKAAGKEVRRCTVCGEMVGSKYLGCGGRKEIAHKVKGVTFYSQNADLKINNVTPPWVGENFKGNKVTFSGKTAQFRANSFGPQDPEVIDVLMKRMRSAGGGGDLMNASEWKDFCLTDKQRADKATASLAETSALMAEKDKEIADLRAALEGVKGKAPGGQGQQPTQ